MELRPEELWPLIRKRLKQYIVASTWDYMAVAKATDSTSNTVAKWLVGGEPNGERLIRLWHFLAVSGIESPELNTLDDFNRYCGELLAFGVVCMDDLLAICGVKNANGVLRALRGTPPMHPQLTYAELQEDYDHDLQAAKDAIAIIAPPTRADAAPKPAPQQKPKEPTAQPLDYGLATQAAAAFNAALAWARLLDSDKATPEMRSAVRELMGDEGMFDLSNLIVRLCSERSRNQRS